MSIEQMTVDATFRQFGKAAVYTAPAPDGSTTACTVIRDTSDRVTAFGDAQVVAGGVTLEVRASEVATPKRGGMFAIGAATYRVAADPEAKDPERLVWSMTAKVVA